MHKFTSNIPIIVNNISTMQDVSAQNMDLSGSLDVSQNTTIGGTLSVIGNTAITGDVVVAGDLTAENLIVGSTNVITELTSLDTRLDAEEPKTTALQTLTEGHTDDIASNTANILTKQATITTATDLDCNSITTNHLEVDNMISTSQFFDTIVVRRPTAINGNGSDRIGVKELQCWVNGVNIMIDNGLTSYFASWLDKDTDTGPQNVSTPTTNAYNNSIDDLGALSSSTEGINSALIIKNIPTTSIHNIQAIVFYSRDSNDTLQTSVGLGIELYNSTNDPNLTTPLASTPVITATALLVYRYDFPSIDTYTDFVGVNSITNIVNNTFAFTQVIVVISYTEITGDVVVAGDLTAENFIVGSTNVITELTSLDTLTAGHTDDIATNTANILTKQDTLDFDSLVEGFNILGNLNFSNPDDTLSEYLDYGILNTLRLRTETFETTLTANNIELAGNLTAENLIVGSTNVITEINTKQATITDGSLTIARTSGLQTALNAKQATITDGSLTIARTNGLQTALNAKQATITTSTSLSLDILTAKNVKSQNLTGTGELTVEGLGLNYDAYLDIKNILRAQVLTLDGGWYRIRSGGGGANNGILTFEKLSPVDGTLLLTPLSILNNGDILTQKNLYVGQNTNDSSTKSIFFGGVFNDNTYDHTVIENRIYSVNTERSELLLFKGNDTSSGAGPDRIRLRAATIAFDTYPADTTIRTNENIRMTILSNGNVGIGTTTPTALLDVNGTGRITGTTTLTGNVGIGGASGTETLLVTGSERITGNLDVSGDFTVTGDEGDAFKIDYAGNSHFYKEVDIVKDDVSFDTILIRRTDAVVKAINLRTLQVFVNGVNILPSSTNSTPSIGSGSIGNVIEYMTWNNSVVKERNSANMSSIGTNYASNIRLNNVADEFVLHSFFMPYMSLYIPLTQSFSISDVQSVVLYNRAPDAIDRINGFQIELYNRSSGFTPGVNVLYTMPINTSEPVYRFDFPSISSYSGGFSSGDSQTQIKTVTVSSSSQNFNTTLLKVEGGNVEFGGGLSVAGNLDVSGDLTVSGTTSLNDLSVSGLITQSNTIRFKAYYVGVNAVTTTVSSGNNVPYNTISFDIGNGFNTSTNTYVVPVAGTYFFGGTWFKNSSTVYTVDYQKNGISVKRNECQFSSGGFSIIPTFLIEDCVVGDEIRLRIMAGSIFVGYASPFPNGYIFFEGYRLG